ncbi:MAG: hypothetical protein WC517_02760 [Patescibacteria group bacterium]
MANETPQGITTKKPLGEILIQLKIITSEQLGEALHKQKTVMSHRKIGEILVRLGYIDKRHIVEALLIQNPDRSNEDVYYEVHDTLPPLSPLPPLVVHPVEMPKWEFPTLSVGVLTAYGNGGYHGALAGADFFRQAGESNEALAKRAAETIEQLALKELADDDARKHFEQLEDGTQQPFDNADIRQILDDYKSESGNPAPPDEAALDQSLKELHEQVGEDDSDPEETPWPPLFDVLYDDNPPTEEPPHKIRD